MLAQQDHEQNQPPQQGVVSFRAGGVQWGGGGIQLEKQPDHNFIDLKKAFEMVWHDGLLKVHRRFDIDGGLVQIVLVLYVYDHASSELFRTVS